MWGYVIWAIILVIIIGMLVRMRSLFSIYICPKCKAQFTLTPLKELIFPQVMYKKITRCPNCRKMVAAAIIRNQDNIDEIEKLEKANKKKNQIHSKRNKK